MAAMNKAPPEFRKVNRQYAWSFINGALTGPQGVSLVRLIERRDHHFRAVFKRSYFQLNEGAAAPSKSQWNTLKKRLKRRNRLVFIFREYGACDCDGGARDRSEGACFYLDFGFLRG